MVSSHSLLFPPFCISNLKPSLNDKLPAFVGTFKWHNVMATTLLAYFFISSVYQ